MKKNIKAFSRVLYEVTADRAGKDLSEVIARFVVALSRQRLLKSAPQIIAEFERYAKEKSGLVEIEITSSRELAVATVNQIKKVFGEKVEASVKVEPSLLGGVVIRTKDAILDGSLKTQLLNLKMKLAG